MARHTPGGRRHRHRGPDGGDTGINLRILTLSLITGVGLLTAAVCGGYVLADWARLSAAYTRFQHLSLTGADLRALFVADAVQNVHRLNCFAEGLGVLAGLLIAALGLHGLCLLPHKARVPNNAP